MRDGVMSNHIICYRESRYDIRIERIRIVWSDVHTYAILWSVLCFIFTVRMCMLIRQRHKRPLWSLPFLFQYRFFQFLHVLYLYTRSHDISLWLYSVTDCIASRIVVCTTVLNCIIQYSSILYWGMDISFVTVTNMKMLKNIEFESYIFLEIYNNTK